MTMPEWKQPTSVCGALNQLHRCVGAEANHLLCQELHTETRDALVRFFTLQVGYKLISSLDPVCI